MTKDTTDNFFDFLDEDQDKTVDKISEEAPNSFFDFLDEDSPSKEELPAVNDFFSFLDEDTDTEEEEVISFDTAEERLLFPSTDEELDIEQFEEDVQEVQSGRPGDVAIQAIISSFKGMAQAIPAFSKFAFGKGAESSEEAREFLRAERIRSEAMEPTPGQAEEERSIDELMSRSLGLDPSLPLPPQFTQGFEDELKNRTLFPRAIQEIIANPKLQSFFEGGEDFATSALELISERGKDVEFLLGTDKLSPQEKGTAGEIGALLPAAAIQLVIPTLTKGIIKGAEKAFLASDSDVEIHGIVNGLFGLGLEKGDNPFFRKLILSTDEILLGSIIGMGIQSAKIAAKSSLLASKGLIETGKVLGKAAVIATPKAARPAIRSFVDKYAPTEYGKRVVQSVTDASIKSNKFIENTYSSFIDMWNPLINAERAAKGTRINDGLQGIPDSVQVMNLSDNGHTLMLGIQGDDVFKITEKGVLQKIPGVHGMAGIKIEIEKAGGVWEDAVEFKAMKRIIKDDELGREIGSNINLDEAKALVAKVSKTKWGKVADEEFNKFFHGILTQAKSGGTIGNKDIARMRQTYGDSFFPVRREGIPAAADPEIFQREAIAAGKAFAEAKGGTQPYLDWFEGLQHYLSRETVSAHRNSVLNRVVKIIDKAPDQFWERHFITPKAIYQKQLGFGLEGTEEVGERLLKDTPLDDTAIKLVEPTAEEIKQGVNPSVTFLQDGKRIHLEMKQDSSLWKSLKVLNPDKRGGNDQVTRLVSTMSRVSKKMEQFGITLRPAFIVRQAQRDIFTAEHNRISIRTQGEAPLFIEGLRLMTESPQAYQNYLADVGGLGTSRFVNLQTKTDEALVSARELRTPGATVNMLSPTSVGGSFIEFVSRLENAPRFAEYTKVLQQTGDRNLAIAASREVTVNFRRQGSMIALRMINQSSVFVNASLQGADRNIRRMMRNPDTFVQQGARFFTIPALIAHYNSTFDPDYFSIPQADRTSKIIFSAGGMNMQQTPPIGMAETFIGIPLLALEEVRTGENLDMEEYRQVVRAMIAMASLDISLIPTAADVASIATTGRDISGQVDIREGEEPETLLFKEIERLLPTGMTTRLEEISKKTGGFIFDSIVATSDPVIRFLREDVARVAKPGWDLPVLNVFIKDNYSGTARDVINIDKNTEILRKKMVALRTLQRTNKASEPQKQELASLKEANPNLLDLHDFLEPRMNKIYKFYSIRNEVTDNPTMTAEEKSREIFRIKENIEGESLAIMEQIKSSEEFIPFQSLTGFPGMIGKGTENAGTQMLAAVFGAVAKEPDSNEEIPITDDDRLILNNSFIDTLSGGKVEDTESLEEDISAKALSQLSGRTAQLTSLSEYNIYDDFLKINEGGLHTKAYVPWRPKSPKWNNSGVTVGEGVDLQFWGTSQALKKLDIDKKIKDKIRPYGGKNKQEALTLLRKKPLTLSKNEALELSEAVQEQIVGEAKQGWDNRARVKFKDLTRAQRTAILDFAYQRGSPALWDEEKAKWITFALIGDWKGAALELRKDTVDSRRRMLSAELLEQDKEVETKQKTVPTPTPKDTSILINNPDLLSEFNKEFGKGIGEEIIRRFT